MKGRDCARWGLGLFYGTAGVLHLALPKPFVSIMPPALPEPALIVALTGAAEMAGAAGLLQARWHSLRRAAGLGLALYALCVWPANVWHMMLDLHRPGGLGLAYHVPRLAAQPVLVWLALWASDAIRWPSR